MLLCSAAWGLKIENHKIEHREKRIEFPSYIGCHASLVSLLSLCHIFNMKVM
jgi:hypothetical protein